ncbi:MAG TPA: M48 family metallopeptidase [Saprospiraceae bacterium]|nr:M48 family metallopeptidase [Saprospiraceae bacterium]
MRINKGSLAIGLIILLFTLFKYYSSTQVNEVTGEKQHIALSVQDEIAMGLQSAPQMAAEFGGLSSNLNNQAIAKKVGQRIVAYSSAANTPYKFDFHLLADPNTVNAFALPGGQIFITDGLLRRLKTEDQLAGVLGHEAGHVVARHSAEKMAEDQLYQGILNSATIGSGGDMSVAQIGQLVAGSKSMKFGRNQELQSDDLGVRFMIEAGYDPTAMIDVMEILKEASGGRDVPEFQSTHPSPENRVQHIQEAIQKYNRIYQKK